MMKKAQSEIITTILLILIVLSAVLVTWMVVKNLIEIEPKITIEKESCKNEKGFDTSIGKEWYNLWSEYKSIYMFCLEAPKNQPSINETEFYHSYCDNLTLLKKSLEKKWGEYVSSEVNEEVCTKEPAEKIESCKYYFNSYVREKNGWGEEEIDESQFYSQLGFNGVGEGIAIFSSNKIDKEDYIWFNYTGTEDGGGWGYVRRECANISKEEIDREWLNENCICLDEPYGISSCTKYIPRDCYFNNHDTQQYSVSGVIEINSSRHECIDCGQSYIFPEDCQEYQCYDKYFVRKN